MEFMNNNFAELNTTDMETIDGGVNWDAVGGAAAIGGGAAIGTAIGGPAGGVVGGIAGALIYYLWD